MILLLNTLIILIKWLIITMYIVLLMEGRQNVRSPWYLMPNDNLGKVECKFCNNVILYHKDRMLFHLGYWYDGNEWTRVVVCSKAHPWVNIICLMWWTCPSTIKQHGNTNPCFRWVNKGCGHGNIKSFNGKKICFNISNGRGSKFHPPYKQLRRS